MRSFFFLTLLLSSSVAFAQDAGQSMCPKKRADVKVGSTCSGELTCTYSKDRWCRCAQSSCVSPAGEIPDCVPTWSWVCRDDGCPRRPTGSCSKEGKRCDYDDAMCSRSAVCTKGTWVNEAPNCRPAAPPN